MSNKKEQINNFRFNVVEDLDILLSMLNDIDVSVEAKNLQLHYRIARIYQCVIQLKLIERNTIPFDLLTIVNCLGDMNDCDAVEDLNIIQHNIVKIKTKIPQEM